MELPTNSESSYGTRPLGGISGVTLHYTAGPPSQTVRQVAAYQTSEAARAQTGAGVPFPGLAYTLFVQDSGRVYWAHDLNVRVWHSAAFVDGKARNATHVGICYAGFSGPNAAQIVGLGRAISWVQRQLGRQLSVEGHRDAPYATSCPGPLWPGWKQSVLDEIRA